MDWVTEPHELDPAIGAAVFRVEDLLSKGHTPTLSDNPDRVLRASELVPNTWEALVGRLTAGERRELFGVIRP